MTDQPDDTHDGNTKPLPLGSTPTSPTEPLASDSLVTEPVAQYPTAAPVARATPRWLPWLLVTAGVAVLALLTALVLPLLRDLGTADPAPSVTPTQVTPSATPEQEQPQEEPPVIEEPELPVPEPTLPIPEPSEEPSTEPTPEEPAP